jgi:hypothetical protein
MAQLTDQVAQTWIDRYVDAWRSNDRSKIVELFAPDATYRYGPWDEPIAGPEAIADSWLESPDAPDSWEARYEPIAIRDDLAVIHGRTRYFDSDRTQVRTQYDNVFLVRFDDTGRATDFTEWYIEKPKQPGA